MTESDTFTWLMAASALIWLGLGAYVTFIAVAQRTLQKRLKNLELWNHDNEA